MALQIKRCGWCGEEFAARRSDAKWCSTACRMAAHRRKTGKTGYGSVRRTRTSAERKAATGKGENPRTRNRYDHRRWQLRG